MKKAYVHTTMYEFEDADKCYDKILQIDPLHADSISDKGAILCIKGKYMEAIALFDKALKIDKTNVRTLRNKAKALRALGHRGIAKKCDEEASKIESDQKMKLN